MLSNPLNQSDDEPMQLLGVVEDKIVGNVDLIPGKILLKNGESRKFLWVARFGVHESARSSLLGLKLIKQTQALSEIVAVCGVSQQALPVYKSFRWTHFELPRFILLRRSGSVLSRGLKSETLGRILSTVVDPMLGRYTRWLLRETNRDLHVLMSTTKDASVSKALAFGLQETRTVCTFAPRTVDGLHWRLMSAEVQDPRDANLLITAMHGNAAVGYVLLKLRFHPVASVRGFKNVFLATLLDWMVLRPEQIDFKTIVKIACREALVQGADAVEICGSNQHEIDALRTMRLPRIGSTHFFWRAAKGCGLDDLAFREQEQWMVRVGDDDLFI